MNKTIRNADIRPEVRNQIERMSEEEILCRTFGHQWDPESATSFAGYYEMYLACQRCGTERDKVSEAATGFPLPNRYRKGQHYKGLVDVGFLTAGERGLITHAAKKILQDRSKGKNVRHLRSRTA